MKRSSTLGYVTSLHLAPFTLPVEPPAIGDAALSTTLGAASAPLLAVTPFHGVVGTGVGAWPPRGTA